MTTSSMRRGKTRSPRTGRKPPGKRLVTPEDLLQYQIVSDPQVAPDGSAVIFVKKQAGEKNAYVSNLWTVATDGQNQPRQFTSGGRDSQPRWSPDGTRVAFVSGRDKPREQIWTLNSSGGEATALTRFPEGSLGTFKWSPDGTLIAASFREQDPDWTEKAKADRKEKGLSDPPRVIDDWWYRFDGDGYFNAQRHHLFLINTITGEHRVIYSKDTLGQFSFDFSPDSRQLVIATNRDRAAMIRPWKTELLRLEIATGRLNPILGLPEGPKDGVQWSPDGRWIAYAGRAGRSGLYDTENLELWICDPIHGQARCLTGQEDYCLMAVTSSDSAELSFSAKLCWAHDSRRIYVQIGWQGESHIASVPTRGGRLQFHTHGARVHTLGNLSADGRLLAFTMGSANALDEVYVSQARPNHVRALTNFNGPLLRGLLLAQPEPAWVEAADGHRVQVWMMKPPAGARRRGRCPAVLEIHGGPHAQYGVGFFHEFQVLCAAGYGVFFSNPRGSKGYGRAHCAAIRGDWGNKDWLDLQAVTEFMKALTWVNPKRLGVMGGSYGGYLTNWAIGHTHNFAAAITDRCVSNLVSMQGTTDYLDAPDTYWPGNSWDRSEDLWRMSPLKYLGQCRTPTLVIHSEGDLRCNIEQAEQVFSVLKLNRVPTRLVRYPASSSHGMSRSGPPDLRLHRLHQILGWWKRWLG